MHILMQHFHTCHFIVAWTDSGFDPSSTHSLLWRTIEFLAIITIKRIESSVDILATATSHQGNRNKEKHCKVKASVLAFWKKRFPSVLVYKRTKAKGQSRLWHKRFLDLAIEDLRHFLSQRIPNKTRTAAEPFDRLCNESCSSSTIRC